MSDQKVLILPCSGIGKVYGLISREAALQVVQKLRPDSTDLMCLALLVTDDPDAKARIKNAPCVTIDGCPKLCAAKNAELAGGRVLEQVRAVDAFRQHRGVQAGTATALTADGEMLVRELAEQVAALVDTAKTRQEVAGNDGNH